MPCLCPILVKHPALRKTDSPSAERLKHLYETDLLSYVAVRSTTPNHIVVPCGKCYECRKARSRQWAVRLMAENAFGRHRNAVFVTFTIKEFYMSQAREDLAGMFRKFRDRWRKRFGSTPVWWFSTELGERTGRLHLHGVVWDIPFFLPNNVHHSKVEMAKVFNKLWKYGHVWVDYASDKTMNYIVKYMVKVDLKDPLTKRKIKWDILTYKPKIFCSPGIGRAYYEQCIDEARLRRVVLTESYDVTAQNYSIYFNGFPYPVPRYFRVRCRTDEEARIANIRRVLAMFQDFRGGSPPFRRFVGKKEYTDIDAYVRDVNRAHSDLLAYGLCSQRSFIDSSLVDCMNSAFYHCCLNYDNYMKKYGFAS